jgi:hypothetical protein
MPAMDIASSDIRARIKAGRSIRYLVPAAVARYIEQHRLYRTPTTVRLPKSGASWATKGAVALSNRSGFV